MNDWVDAEQHVERAHEAYEAGRWDVAESELRRALAVNPYQAEWHFNLGLTLEAAGRHLDAAGSFQRAAELDTEQSQAAVLTGANLIRGGRPAESLAWLAKAADQQPDSTLPFVYRIEAHTSLGDHDQAELDFYLGQQINPEDAELYAALAESLMSRDLFDRAVWCLREAARLDPELPRIQARLAEAYARTGRLERARQLYLRELRRDPGDIDTLLDLGDLLAEMSRFDEAEEKFRRVLELEPDSVEAHEALGDLADRRGRPGEAIVRYDVVVRLQPEYRGARRRLAALLLRRGSEADRVRAGELLTEERRSWESDPESVSVGDLEELGNLLLDVGQAEHAEAAFERLAGALPEDHIPVHLLSVTAFERGDAARGMRLAREVLARKPRFVAAMHNLALAHLRRREWLRARYWVHQARAVAPEDPAIRRLRMTLRLWGIASVLGWALGRVLRVARWGVRMVGRPSRPRAQAVDAR